MEMMFQVVRKQISNVMMCSFIFAMTLLGGTIFFLCGDEMRQVLLLGYAEHDSQTFSAQSGEGLEFWEFDTAN